MQASASPSVPSARARKLTFVFTVRRDGQAWLVQDSYGAVLGRLPERDDAMQTARRASVLMSETGVRVIVMLESPLREFYSIFTAEPLSDLARPALLS
jgi:hypothetical protein